MILISKTAIASAHAYGDLVCTIEATIPYYAKGEQAGMVNESTVLLVEQQYSHYHWLAGTLLLALIGSGEF